MSTTPNGYIAVTGVLNVNLPVNINAPAQQISFNGGTFTITASGLSPVSYITVNGFKGALLTYSPSAATYTVPALVTPSTQTAFSLKTVALLPSSAFSYFSDSDPSSNVSATFDGLINTYYGSSNAQCWIGLDAGVGLQVSVSRIGFFPNIDWPSVTNYTLYSVFQGSNDKTTWNDLSLVDQTVHTGWNILQSKDNTPYRYVRFRHNATSRCQLAEIQLYGIILNAAPVSLTSQLADIIYADGFNTKTFTNGI